MIVKLKEFFFRDWTVEEKFLVLADICLLGILIGFITSPFKGGLFSNNVIRSQNEEVFWDDDEEELDV